MTFEHLFQIGMDREIGTLVRATGSGISIGLGEGGQTVKKSGHLSLGLPSWSFPRDRIPCSDGSVGIIHCYHFIEHLTGDDAIDLLMDVQRVLLVGGIFQYCIPLANTEMANHDLTHKSYWTESTFQNLMENKWYDPSGCGYEWKLRRQYQVIAGIVERNLALLGQLVRMS